MAYMNRIVLSPPNSVEARYGQHKNWLTHIFQLFNDSLVFKSWVKNDQSRELLGKDRYLLSFNIFPVVPKIGKWIHRHKNFLLVSLSLIHRAGNFRSWVNPRIFWWGVGVGNSENYDSGSLFSTLELKKNPEIFQDDLTLNTSYRVI